MVDRASVNENAQWALETTPGTAVAADKAVRSMSINLGVEGDNDAFRPDGQKFASLVAPNMEWTSWRLEGRPTYTEINYPLSMLCHTPTEVAVGTTGKKRTYAIRTSDTDTVKTATIEKGSSVRAAKIAYGLLTDLGLTFGRKNGVGITGAGIGRILTDGITKTATPTKLPLVPILGKQLDFYIDPSAATLGATKMLRAFAVEPQISNKAAPVWAIDSAQASFAGHVEVVPAGKQKITLEADAAGMAYLSQFRSGDTIFTRLEAIGPEFETGQTYKFTYDACLGILSVPEYGDDLDGVTIVSFDTEFVDSAGWGGVNEVQTITITGTPTGGTFTLTFDGATTAAIAFNASAAAVQSALEALGNIAVGDVTATGGPFPGTAVVVTFGGAYAGLNVPLMTADGALLTGGATPAVTAATTTAGGGGGKAVEIAVTSALATL